VRVRQRPNPAPATKSRNTRKARSQAGFLRSGRGRSSLSVRPRGPGSRPPACHGPHPLDQTAQGIERCSSDLRVRKRRGEFGRLPAVELGEVRMQPYRRRRGRREVSVDCRDPNFKRPHLVEQSRRSLIRSRDFPSARNRAGECRRSGTSLARDVRRSVSARIREDDGNTVTIWCVRYPGVSRSAATSGIGSASCLFGLRFSSSGLVGRRARPCRRSGRASGWFGRPRVRGAAPGRRRLPARGRERRRPRCRRGRRWGACAPTARRAFPLRDGPAPPWRCRCRTAARRSPCSRRSRNNRPSSPASS